MDKYFKQTIVSALQYTGYNDNSIIEQTGNLLIKHPIYSEMINQNNGDVLHVGDYIVKDGNTIRIKKNIDFEREYKKL